MQLNLKVFFPNFFHIIQSMQVITRLFLIQLIIAFLPTINQSLSHPLYHVYSSNHLFLIYHIIFLIRPLYLVNRQMNHHLNDNHHQEQRFQDYLYHLSYQKHQNHYLFIKTYINRTLTIITILQILLKTLFLSLQHFFLSDISLYFLIMWLMHLI